MSSAKFPPCFTHHPNVSEPKVVMHLNTGGIICGDELNATMNPVLFPF